tara:strand:+ start:7603 stop:13074 length:5472 start_codon:yes stop_codon:yes gene_type:complete
MAVQPAKKVSLEELRARVSENSGEASKSNTSVEPAKPVSLDEMRARMAGAQQSSQGSKSFGDYLKAVPAAGIDLAIGSAEAVTSALGQFSGNFELAKNVSEFRTDVNDSILSSVPESERGGFAYNLFSGAGSTLPYLALGVLTKGRSLKGKATIGAFGLAMGAQQGRDDYLATQGVTTATATNEQIKESNKVGSIAALPMYALNAMGASAILKPLLGGGSVTKKVFMDRLKQYAGAGLIEGATEGAQTGLINYIASDISKYDENRPITQGVVESAMIGFLIGGGMNVVTTKAQDIVTQTDRMSAGVMDGSINANDVADPELGSKFAGIAIENNAVPEPDTRQQNKITNPNSFTDFASKIATPMSRRLGRAGKEFVREFRQYELETGRAITEAKEIAKPFEDKLLEMSKSNPDDYRILSLALANANELAVDLPQSTQEKLSRRFQSQPQADVTNSQAILNEANPNAPIVNQHIESAVKILGDLDIDVKIEVIEEGDSFYDPMSNTIGISATESDATTVAHELLHTVLGKKAKTDTELQLITKDMFESVIRSTEAGSEINNQLKDFLSQYDTNIQNEEFLAQTVGELARQYTTLDLNTKTRVKVWLNNLMQRFGMQGLFKEAESDVEVVDFLNSFSRFAKDPEGFSAKVSKSFIRGDEGPLNAGFRATKFSLAKDLTKAPMVRIGNKPAKNSNVTKENTVDIIQLLNDAVDQNLNVVVWQADQFGIGKYKSPLTGKSYELDAGIGYALNKKGKSGKYTWATSSEQAARLASEADLVLVVSGDPSTQHYFNRVTAEIVYDNVVASFGSVDKFINQLEDSVANSSRFKKDGTPNPTDGPLLRAISGIHEKFPNKDSLLDQGNARKAFGVALRSRMFTGGTDNLRSQSETPNSLWDKLTRIVPENKDLMDGHLRDNNFKTRDITAVFKPNGVSQPDDGAHRTYKIGIGGSDFAVPDRVINLMDIMRPEFVEEVRRAYPSYENKSEKEIGTLLTGAQAGIRAFVEEDNIDSSPAQAFVKTTQEQIDEAIARGGRNQLGKRPAITPKVKGTPAFKKWFGKGVLVQEDGTPMMLYHGTKEDFTKFETRSERLKNWVFFSPDPDLSSEMAYLKPFPQRMEGDPEANRFEGDVSEDLAGISVMPAFLNAKEIFDPRNSDSLDELQRTIIAKFKGKSPEYEVVSSRFGSMKDGFFGDYEFKIVSESLKSLGYDGIVLSEYQDTNSPRYGLNSIAVWNKNGIKSATANSGAFDPDSSDIRYQKKSNSRKSRRFNRSEMQVASDNERIQGLAREGKEILERYGMVDDYARVRGLISSVGQEAVGLGLDPNLIQNYFPRSVDDFKGLKESMGYDMTSVDGEIARYERATGQKLSPVERQMMLEKLARSRLYRSGAGEPNNSKERRISLIEDSQLQYYASPMEALSKYLEQSITSIETKKLIGDGFSGKTAGVNPVSGRLGKVMDKMVSQGRLRQDQVDVVQGVVEARFGQHGRQFGFVKGAKNLGYIAAMGSPMSTLTQLGDFYFSMVQNGLLPTVQATLGTKKFKMEDLGLAKESISAEHKDAGAFSKSVDTVFKMTGLSAMDKLAKEANINATYNVLQKGAKANQNSKKYKKALARLKRIQGEDAYATIADLKNGVKSDLVVEAIYNELADIAPISLTEMPLEYAKNPNLRIAYSLKSYTIKQFNFIRERTWVKLMEGLSEGNPQKVGEASTDMMKILVFTTITNGSADILKAVMMNREIDPEDFWWNHVLRMFGISKYTTVKARKEGFGSAFVKTISPPQVGILDDITKDILDARKAKDMRSAKYVPVAGKIYYWQAGRGKGVEERLSRLREKD